MVVSPSFALVFRSVRALLTLGVLRPAGLEACHVGDELLFEVGPRLHLNLKVSPELLADHATDLQGEAFGPTKLTSVID